MWGGQPTFRRGHRPAERASTGPSGPLPPAAAAAYVCAMVRLVVALPSEARPLISRWALAPAPGAGDCRAYAGPGIELVVSGVGKAAAAAAVSFLHPGLSPRPAALLNVGVAGHRGAPIGTPFLAARITDRATGASHGPIFPFRLPCATAPVLTVDEPLDDYPEAALCEMEASSFFSAAQCLTSYDLVHCLKIVSDGPQSPWRDLTSDRIASLVDPHTDLVDAVVGALHRCAAARPTPPPGP